MAFLIKHRLRIDARGHDYYSPVGWVPKATDVDVIGPFEAASGEVVLTVWKPDGSEWHEVRTDLPQLEAGEHKVVELSVFDAEQEITDEGECRFTLQAVSELDGVEELLHEGTFTVRKLADGEYAADNSWLMPFGLVGLDVADEHDGPPLKVTVFLGGADTDHYMLEGHLFVDGKRLDREGEISGGWRGSSTKNTWQVSEFTVEFDEVRGWNNLADQDWNPQWHRLDQNPGKYEVKFLREKKLVRTVAFEVGKDGRITKPKGARIEPNWQDAPQLWSEAERKGDFDGEVAKAVYPKAGFYGDPDTAAIDWDLDVMYACCTAGDDADGEGESAGPELDDETAEKLQKVVSCGNQYLHTWEEEMASPDEIDSDHLTACGLIVDFVAEYETKLADLGDAVGEDHVVNLEWAGGETTLGEVTARMQAMLANAEAHIAGDSADTEAELAPFRAVLRNDKLAIFEDHPAPDHRYYTTNKKVIETPEELAEAAFWYFDGSTEIKGKATVRGTSDTVEVTIEGYRVLGYQFDDDHNTVEEHEEQGEGHNAPKTAFHHDAAEAAAKPAKKKAAAKKKPAAQKAKK
jgi:hypothetical protein